MAGSRDEGGGDGGGGGGDGGLESEVRVRRTWMAAARFIAMRDC